LIPLDGGGEAGCEVGEDRLPTEFQSKLGGIYGIAQVMASAIGDVIVCITRLPKQLQDRLDYLLVVTFAVGADQVGLADLAFGGDQQHGGAVIIDVDPVADIESRPVELRPAAVEDIGDLPRNELLDVLVRTVVVRTVAESGLDAEGAHPGTHQVIRASLSGRVWAGRIVGRALGESAVVLEGELAVDLIGGDVVVSGAVSANCLQEGVRPHQVSGDECRWVSQ
jgi:hypothetical protein